jgi:hypothetical protein
MQMNRPAEARISTHQQNVVRSWLLSAIVLCAGFLIVTPPDCFRAEQTVGEGFNILDTSWKLDLGLRLAHGEVAGRDFVFTYGPLGQCVRAAPLLLPRGDLATLLRFLDLPEAWLAALCTWLVLGLWGMTFWRRTVFFLFWLSILPPASTVSGIRPMAGLLLVVLAGRQLGCCAAGTRRFWPLVCWFAAVPLALCYAFDLGVMTLAALLLTATVALITTANLRQPVIRCVSAVGAGLLSLVALPVCRSYLVGSWEVASGYAAAMAVPLDNMELALLAAGLLGGLAIVFYAARAVRREGPYRVQALALLAAACFAVVWIRYGLTRSDRYHCLTALAPAIFLAACLLPAYLRAIGLAVRGEFLAAWSILCVVPIANLVPWQARWQAFCAMDPSPARIEVQNPTVREASLLAQAQPEDSLYVWPYESIVGHLAGKKNPAFTLQSYAAHTDSLEEATVVKLHAAGDPPVLLLLDSWAIDGVENLTRTPRIFRHLLDHYTLGTAPPSSFALLRPHSGASPWHEEPLVEQPHTLAPDLSAQLDVSLANQSSSDCRASDLMLLEFRATNTPSHGIAKPGVLAVHFVLDNGMTRHRRILLPSDGSLHTILVSACTLREPLFLSIFQARRGWRARERVVALQLTWEAMDLLTRRPREITLTRATLLRRSWEEILETSLEGQKRPACWQWCYDRGPRPEEP